MDIISNNIANVNTTRTEKGGPFIRKYIKVTAENGVEIIEDKETEMRLVYDPTHPDAIIIGEKQGYVLYPNIDTVTEMTSLIRATSLYDSITEYLRKNYHNVIF